MVRVPWIPGARLPAFSWALQLQARHSVSAGRVAVVVWDVEGTGSTSQLSQPRSNVEIKQSGMGWGSTWLPGAPDLVLTTRLRG